MAVFYFSLLFQVHRLKLYTLVLKELYLLLISQKKWLFPCWLLYGGVMNKKVVSNKLVHNIWSKLVLFVFCCTFLLSCRFYPLFFKEIAPNGSASMWSLASCDGLKRLFMLAIVMPRFYLFTTVLNRSNFTSSIFSKLKFLSTEYRVNIESILYSIKSWSSRIVSCSTLVSW